MMNEATKSTNSTVSRATFVVSVCLVGVLTAAFTLFLAANTLKTECPQYVRAGNLQLPDNGRDSIDRLHSNGVTALKAYGADKCFILTGDTDAAHSTTRVLTVIGRAMDADQMASLYGEAIADFCDGREGYVVRLQEEHHERLRRQAQSDVRSGPATEAGGRFVNGCQNSNIVQCAGDADAVYKCNTGPAQIYNGEITCIAENQMTFKLTKRCDKYKNTKGLRFIKCLQYFLLGAEKVGEQIEEDK